MDLPINGVKMLYWHIDSLSEVNVAFENLLVTVVSMLLCWRLCNF